MITNSAIENRLISNQHISPNNIVLIILFIKTSDIQGICTLPMNSDNRPQK